MANKVCCKEEQVEESIAMNDRDYLVDVLSSEKQITINTAIFLTECSNKKLEKEIDEIFQIVKNSSKDTYELAWNFGWYTLEEVTKTKTNETIQNLNTKYEELNN